MANFVYFDDVIFDKLLKKSVLGDNDVTVGGQILTLFKNRLHFWIPRPQISLHAYFCVSTVYSLVDLSFDPFDPNLRYNDVMQGSV